MSTTEQRIAANRVNALSSTGPATADGKAAASQNALRHGLRSARMFLDDEDPAEFEALVSELINSLNPVGTVEIALVERIAVNLWRQRRLVVAETASLSLTRQPRKIALDTGNELGRRYGAELKEDDLAPFDEEREEWCQAVLAEIEALGAFDIASIKEHAPLVWQQLTSDAEGDDPQTIASFLSEHKRGLDGFVAELILWCREQLREATARPHVLALAEQVRSKRLVLPADTLELLARYQTTLDNQLYKALRALREAQEWRLKTLEHNAPAVVPLDAVARAA